MKSGPESLYEQILKELTEIQEQLEAYKREAGKLHGPLVIQRTLEEKYFEVLEAFSVNLSKLSPEQVQIIAKSLLKKSGFTLRRLQKARLYGLRKLPRSVLRLDAFTMEIWEALPEQDKIKFRKNTKIPVLDRGACTMKRASQIGNDTIRMLIDPRNPQKGILTIAEQQVRKKRIRSWGR